MSPAARRVMENTQRIRWNAYVASLSPSSWFKLDEASGALVDSGSSPHNGTTHGGVIYNAAGGVLSDSNGALDLNGSTGYFDIGDFYDFPGTAAFSIHALIQLDTMTSTPRVVSKETGGVGWRMTLAASPSATGIAITRVDGGGADNANAGVAVPLSTWASVVGTYDGATLTMYLNGVPGTPVASSRSLPGNAVSLSVGTNPSHGAGTWLDGRVDELMIFSRCLTPGEVAALATIARSL